MNLFHKYRPFSHFIAPHSWSNDPCGATFIPETQEYILCYQWNPGTTEAGNSAWGMARSRDLITWQDCLPALTNGHDTVYDSKGVFSGSISSELIGERRVLYLFYTSVSALPIHWSRSYIQGCESQSVAISTDYGRTWHRHQQNPLLYEPRLKSQTTGWRDPFVSQWKRLSDLRGASANTMYMMLASGERDAGPELVLYESTDLIQWLPLTVLLKAPSETPVSPCSSLLFGRNFECASFFTLGNRDYLLAGIEDHPSYTTNHASRYVLWMCGDLVLDEEGKPKFQVSSHGRLDHGILYAPHVYRGAKTELLLSGWVDEDQNIFVKEQFWAGCVSLPRELIELRHDVIPISSISRDHMWEIDSERNTMTTLGVRPARNVYGLRHGSKMHGIDTLSAVRSKTFEIEALFTRLSGYEKLVFNVRQAPNNREVTRIIIDLSQQTITVDRDSSSLNNGNKSPNQGAFQLLTQEDLHIRIFVDNSVIEVYANDRFALTSRIYPQLETALGVSYDFKNGKETLDCKNLDFTCWEGLRNAWPAREKAPADPEIDVEVAPLETADVHIQPMTA